MNISTSQEIDNLSVDQLRTAIQDFVKGYSVETTPHDIDVIDKYPDFLGHGAAVYVAHVPGGHVDEIIKMSAALIEHGFTAVPHIAARRHGSEALLNQALGSLRDIGVDRILVIAGDVDPPEGPFTSAIDVLKTGLLEKHGFSTVGISGHPEGNSVISDADLNAALMEKAEYAKTSPLNMHITTQFGFSPEAFLQWEQETTAKGVNFPIHIGMAGPVSLKKLIALSMRCGIGDSLKLLKKNASAVANLLTVSGPDPMITAIARHVALTPDSRFKSTHFFAFGGVEKTARWLNAVIRGEFELNKDLTGFSVKA